jgi:hypothetical protein
MALNALAGGAGRGDIHAKISALPFQQKGCQTAAKIAVAIDVSFSHRDQPVSCFRARKNSNPSGPMHCAIHAD